MVALKGLEPPTPVLKVRVLISRSVLLPAKRPHSVRDFDLRFPSWYRPFLCYSRPPVNFPLAVVQGNGADRTEGIAVAGQIGSKGHIQ